MATKAYDFAESPVPAPDGGSSVKPFAAMSEAEMEEFDCGLIAVLTAGDDSAARASLADGVPICYTEEDTPEPKIIKEYPDGRREAIVVGNGSEVFLRRL